MFGNKTDYIVRYGQFEMIELRLMSEDRNSVFKIWELNICYHSPLKTTDKTGFDTWYFRRRTITCKNYLATSFVKGVERMKKLFLCRFFPFQKVNVINQEKINFPITSPKLLGRSPLD